MDVLRTPGQAGFLPGAVRVGAMVFTSGIVAPDALTRASVPIEAQTEGALRALLASLADAGAGRDDVVKLEAYLASAEDFAAWNAAFLSIWPEPGPARTTLVLGFSVPGILIELQAVAVCG